MRRHAKASSAASTHDIYRRGGLLACLAVFAGLLLAPGASAYYLELDRAFYGGGGGSLNGASGVAVEEESGDVYVADTGNNRVQRFDSAGSYLSSFGTEGSGSGQLLGPQGVAVDQADGSVYVADTTNNRVQKFDASGAFVDTFGTEGSGDGEFKGPGGVAVDPRNGDVYVADTGNNRVQRFSSSGEYQSQFGEAGSEPGQLNGPGRLAIDSAGNVYVLEVFGRIQKFDSSGTFLNAVTANFPMGIAVDLATDHVLVTEFTEDFSQTLTTEFDGSGQRIEAYDPFNAVFNTAVVFDTTNRRAFVTGENQVRVLVEPPVVAQQQSLPDFTEAGLSARINPKREALTYFFEYGPTAAYGSSTPEKTLLAGRNQPLPIFEQLRGLPEGASFHYRAVVVNGGGRVEGGDRTFTTQRRAGAGACPNEALRAAQGIAQVGDCRAFEMVSPPDKTGSDATIYFAQSALDGDAINFQSTGSFAGAEAAYHSNRYVSRRTSSGWATEALTPNQPNFTSPYNFKFLYEALSPDLSLAVVRLAHPPYKPMSDTSEDQRLLYLRKADGSYVQLSPPAAVPLAVNPPRYVGSSADMSHIVFESDRHLLPDAPAEGTRALYEWDEGELRLVGVSPTGDAVPAEMPLLSSQTRPVSPDGSQIVFESEGQVYLRTDGATTTPISLSQKTGSEGEPAALGAEFAGSASEDGTTFSKLYFVSKSELTDDAFTGVEPKGYGLYEYDVDSGVLTDLAPTPSGAGTSLVDLDGRWIVASPDGEYVYFYSDSKLTPDADVPSGGWYGLYVWHDGALHYAGFSMYSGGKLPQLSEDGSRALFFTYVPPPPGSPEVLRANLYDAAAGTTTCISCPAAGEPTANSTRTASIFQTAPGFNYIARNLSVDGRRAFFETSQALLSQDSNGVADVYEWEDGRLKLISSGRAAAGAHFMDASDDGDDVFLATRERLSPLDRDGNLDVYDARVDSDLPVPPAPTAPCEGDACQSPPNAPNDATPASSSLRGNGNEPQQRVRKAKKKQKKQAAARKRKAKKKQQKKAKARAAATRKHG